MNDNAMFRALSFSFLIMVSCQSDLTEREKLFVGAWKHKINTEMNPDSTFGYLELRPNRKGRNSIVSNIKGTISHVPAVKYDVTNWRLQHDTLVVEYIMTGGLFSGSGIKDTVMVNDFPVTDFCILKEVDRNEFFAESYSPGIPFISEKKFIRIEEIE